jgi:hypothetical protein
MGDSWTPPAADPNAFFAATPAPSMAPAAAPAAPTASPQVNQFGTPVATPPVNQFGTPVATPPVNQFGTPVNQFGTPVAAPPVGWAPYPVAPPKQSRNMWVVGVAILVGLVSIGAAVQVFMRNHHSLSIPESINGATLMTDPQSQRIKQTMIDGLDNNGIHDSVAGFYGSSGAPASMVLAAHGRGSVDSKMADVEAGLQSSASVTTPMTDEPAGKLGGQMQCGAIGEGSVTVPICVWADTDTVGVVGLFGTPSAEVPSTALTYREAVEH